MKTILIALMGNRDLQVNSDASLPPKYHQHQLLTRNNEGEDFVINKSLVFDKDQPGPSFLDISAEILAHLGSTFKDKIKFPLIEPILDKIEGLDQLVFCTTDQVPKRHHQDCPHIATAAMQYFSGRVPELGLRLIKDDPRHFDQLVEFFNALFNEFPEEKYKVYIATAGGTPDMRSAAHFAGLFREFVYYSVYSGNPARISTKRFDKQEGLILSRIVEEMLEVRDYQGIAKLPVNEAVKTLCHTALKKYNFEEMPSENEELDFAQKSRLGIPLLFHNLAVCYTQGRYADVIGRIFRLEEAIGRLLLYEQFRAVGEEQGKFKVREKVFIHGGKSYKEDVFYSFEELLEKSPRLSSYIQAHFGDLVGFHKRKGVYFDLPSRPNVNTSISLAYYFFVLLNTNEFYTSFFGKLHNGYSDDNDPLTELRNKCILGHHFKGVSQQEIENICAFTHSGEVPDPSSPAYNFQAFTAQIKKILSQFDDHLSMNLDDPFTEIDEAIRQQVGL